MSGKLKVLALVGLSLGSLFVLNLISVLVVSIVIAGQTGWFSPGPAWYATYSEWSVSSLFVVFAIGVIVALGFLARSVFEWWSQL